VSETISHTRLVEAILNWVDSRLLNIPGVCLYCDCPPVRVTEKPPSIDTYYPDVSVATVPGILTIVGEAKTITDLETARSYRQLVAFLRFLRVQPGPQFVMATPWQAGVTAKNLVRLAKREADAISVPVTFLSDLSTDA